jgi:hypothetical protein
MLDPEGAKQVIQIQRTIAGAGGWLEAWEGRHERPGDRDSENTTAAEAEAPSLVREFGDTWGLWRPGKQNAV